MPEPQLSKPDRYHFLDALRGIAAVAVLMHHAVNSTVMKPTLRHILPPPLLLLADYGAFGVEIFFVLSGFVIAHSLRSIRVQPATIANFILRRQIRLDLPYWTLIFISLLDQWAERHMHGLAPRGPMPDALDVLCNMLYLQNILHRPQIVGVAWTLCIEIQFYMVFIGLLGFGQWKRRGDGELVSARTVALILLSGALSLISLHWCASSPWFTTYWLYFAAGVIVYWGVQKRAPLACVLAYLAAFSIAALWCRSPALCVGAATAIAIYIAGCKGRLGDWLDTPVLWYLGRISYSIYLVHYLVVTIVLRLGNKLTGENAWAASGWLLLTLAVTGFSAHLLYTLVERPSMQLSSWLKTL